MNKPTNIKAFQAAFANMNETVRPYCTEPMAVRYSAYETDAPSGEPVNNLYDIAIKGKVVFQQKRDDFLSPAAGGTDFVSEELRNPTWLEVAIVADAMIKTTGDIHHCFLENVRDIKERTDMGVKIYDFVMGS